LRSGKTSFNVGAPAAAVDFVFASVADKVDLRVRTAPPDALADAVCATAAETGECCASRAGARPIT
jgi:hypothetical protein